MPDLKDRGTGWVLAEAALLAALLVSGPAFRGDWMDLRGLVLGATFLCLGTLVAIASRHELGRGWTWSPIPPDCGHLIVAGPYLIIRHPYYAALRVMAAGWMLVWESWAALGCGIALSVFLTLKSNREERALAARFPDYALYRTHAQRTALNILGWALGKAAAFALCL
jgi:protein-S-isoprenylcysteine O-methyltransferase Ste14